MTEQLENIEGLEQFAKPLSEEAVDHFSDFVGPPQPSYFGRTPERQFSPEYQS